MIPVLLVMAGGAIGSLGRYEVGRLCAHLFGVGWPWGTLAVNMVGGLVMGLLAGWLAMRGQAGEPIRLFLAVGVTGGFTTFSAFSLETMMMIQRGDFASALTYILVSVIGAVAMLALGLFIMRGATA